jgi:malectin (di-glucose binding ER protein)
MNSVVVTVTHPNEIPSHLPGQREDLVRRVASSATFEKSPRLRAFFLHVCQCALDNKPEEATEQQIGIYVYNRPPGYNPNEDNIVRSQARVLRMKLEHHFATDGKDEAVIITVPKGRYLPVFELRSEQPVVVVPVPAVAESKTRRLRQLLIGLAGITGVAVVWLAYLLFTPKSVTSASSVISAAAAIPDSVQSALSSLPKGQPLAVAPGFGEVRIAAGRTGTPYVDLLGHRWETDHYYEGGVPKPGPRYFFPPVADETMFKTMREAMSADPMVPQWFRYDIPLHPGAYELRLYFADPLRQPDVERKEDAQNIRHFQVSLNGHPLLVGFDPIADAGSAAVDVRAFRDVGPAQDGRLHLEFSGGERPFVNAVELTPGTPGKLKPIRISVHPSDFVDADGTRWSGDEYFIDGRTVFYENPQAGPKIPALYVGERHGNFSYAIPVVPGSYTVKLHFLESFFSPLIPAAPCRGIGCRVFDVTCNGVTLLQDFDIVRAASGAFQPLVREFHGLHPNGQGKLLLSFSPKVNYAEIRAIEVIDEAK